MMFLALERDKAAGMVGRCDCITYTEFSMGLVAYLNRRDYFGENVDSLPIS